MSTISPGLADPSNRSGLGYCLSLKLQTETIPGRTKLAALFPPGSRQVVAIQVHHLVPCSHKVLHKRLFRVVTCIDFRNCSELRVRTEDKVDTGADPLEFARLAIAPFIYTFGCRGGLPLRIHVE